MATIEYSLFRANFIKPTQIGLFNPDLSSEDLLLKSIAERPSAELRKGHVWHIGNLHYFSDLTGYFAIGRTTKATIEKFDEHTRNFVEEQQETSPYTHCVFNAAIGLIGIAKKTSLARTTNGMARRFEELLSQCAVVSKNSISVEILPIPDPDGFLRALGSAYRVMRFMATFHGPNSVRRGRAISKATIGLSVGRERQVRQNSDLWRRSEQRRLGRSHTQHRCNGQ